MLFGAVPIVNDFAPLNPLFRDSPVMTLKAWEKGYQREDLENYEVPTKSRKLMLMQYWADRIKCLKINQGLWKKGILALPKLLWYILVNTYLVP